MKPEDEAYAQQLIEKMKMQNKMMQQSGMPFRSPDNISGNLTDNISQQDDLNSVNTSIPPTPAIGAFDVCSQCGTIHPPVEKGKICPVAASNKVKEDSGLNEDNITQFISNLRNIAMSQISSKKIKDGNKLLKHLTLTFMKVLEEYKE